MMKKVSYARERRKLLALLAQADPQTDEYEVLQKRLRALEESDASRKSRRVTGDTIVKCAVNVGITAALVAIDAKIPVSSGVLRFINPLR